MSCVRSMLDDAGWFAIETNCHPPPRWDHPSATSMGPPRPRSCRPTVMVPGSDRRGQGTWRRGGEELARRSGARRPSARLSRRSGIAGLGRRDEIDELFGQTVCGGTSETNGHDDRALSSAKPHHPCLLGRTASRGGRAHVDLDGDGRALRPLCPVRTRPAGRRAEPGGTAGALPADRLGAAGPGTDGACFMTRRNWWGRGRGEVLVHLGLLAPARGRSGPTGVSGWLTAGFWRFR